MNKGFLGIALAAHELWLRDDVRGSRANLPGANLSGADLSRANLPGANLSGADLSRANLPGANLSRAYLSRANLSGANLSGAYLSRANLSGANLSGADLSGANLSGANLSGANLSGANLSGANMSWADRIIGPLRSDGYLFTFCAKDDVVLAGCRRMTIDQFRAHTATYIDDSKRAETLAILDCLELLAKARIAQ